jgi:thioredoxin reductase
MEKTDVAIIGAGPYGLSLAAHLTRCGCSIRHFGNVMQAWKSMPKGMFLKSQGFASNLSDPDGTHTLAAFCGSTGRTYGDYGVPVPLDTFVAYGEWFAHRWARDVEDVVATGLAADGAGFRVELADGRTVLARRVAVATGLAGAARRLPELAELPPQLASHTSDQDDLAAFAGRRVVVLGAGQSALESAALLHEAGADVELVARRRRLSWNGDPLAAQRSLYRRLREPEAPLGSGWGTWFYSNQPDLYRRLPAQRRLHTARTALGPAGAFWLRPRVEGRVPTKVGTSLEAVETDGDQVRLETRDLEGQRRVLHCDHVLAGTGYSVDLARMGYLDPELRDRLTTLGGTPQVGRDYQSGVRGLYFIGPAVAPSMGPVMRFAYGSAHAARSAARSIGTSLTHRDAVGIDA